VGVDYGKFLQIKFLHIFYIILAAFDSPLSFLIAYDFLLVVSYSFFLKKLWMFFSGEFLAVF
jgi:hypothetical protein